MRNAGGHWVDQSAVRDAGSGFPIVTSRTPKDLDDFLGQVEAVLGA